MINVLKCCAYLVLLSPFFAVAASNESVLDAVDIDVSDTASLQRGAAVYFNYCLGCHSLKYARYNRIAHDLQISESLFQEHLLFSKAPIGELIDIPTPKAEAKQWFGAAPPDLTLVSRVRSDDWLYTYLRSFYQDESRPFGVNNALFANVGMPHVLMELQGLCANKPHPSEQKVLNPDTGSLSSAGGCEQYAVVGTMDAQAYDQTVYDLTNFLKYMGEPAQLKRQRIGVLVMAYLLVLLMFAWLYYRELWKDVR